MAVMGTDASDKMNYETVFRLLLTGKVFLL